MFNHISILTAGSLGVIAALVGTGCAGSGERAFDEQTASRLQAALEAATESPETQFPGAILYVSNAELGTWIGTAGLGDIETKRPIHPDDRFRAGSIVKPFVSAVVLQLVEEGAFALDDPLPAVLQARVVTRFRNSDQITVRMLLNHSSGIPDWLTPAVTTEIADHPSRVWNAEEILDIAAEQSPSFPPGTSYRYSNTDYNLLGLIIEEATDTSWRDEVRDRVIEPLGLKDTLLPDPGDTSIPGDHARGYGSIDGAVVDITAVDPSMAGPAGGSALVTTVSDLARFLDALLSGKLFERAETLDEMLAFIDAPDVGGQVGYGLGMQRYVLPDGTEVIGHLGGTAGYTAFVGRLSAEDVTVAAAMNWNDDPTPVLLPALEIIKTTLEAAAGPLGWIERTTDPDADTRGE